MSFPQILIYIHASFGGLALFSGLISLIVKKGSSVHKKAGKIFFFSMLFSAFVALIISVLPEHQSTFLFTIGLFSSYFVLTGYRALKFKYSNPKLVIDKIISLTMFVTSIIMILYPIFLLDTFNIVLFVFGITGLIFSVLDLRTYKNSEKLKKDWLKMHLGKMMGGYISATTAFVVVNQFFPSFYGWFIPGIIGSLFIAYWNRKISHN